MDESVLSRLLATPLQVTWTVTSRCNLGCAYCLESSLPADAPDDATPAERERIVRELVSCRALGVGLSGGEPLLVPETPDYARALVSAGAAVRVTTNGTLVDERMADRLARVGLTAVEVSLQPGTDALVLECVRRLVSRGLRTLLRLVVTPAMLADPDGVASRLEPFASSGVERIGLQEVMPLGRACENPPACAMSLGGIERAREVTQRMREKWGDSFVSFASATASDAALGHPVPCSLGDPHWKSCEVRPDGNVVPCAPASAFGVANSLHEHGLAECWRRLRGLYAPFASAPLQGRCAECVHAPECRGGCRAVAYHLRAAGRRDGACVFFTAAGGGGGAAAIRV